MSHVTRHALCPACGRFILIHDGARIAHQIAHAWSGLDDQRRRHAIDECAGSRTVPTPEELASGLAHDLLMVDVRLAKARAQVDHYRAQVERLMTERTALMEGARCGGRDDGAEGRCTMRRVVQLPRCLRCDDTGYVETRKTFPRTKYGPECTVVDSVACSCRREREGTAEPRASQNGGAR